MAHTIRTLFLTRFVAVLCLLACLSAEANATWTKIANLGVPIGCCFFTDDNHGFAGSGNSSKQITLQIWYTSDGGKTWTASAVPGGSGFVSQICIGKDGVGYASIFVNTGTPFMNLWKTTDNGVTWFDVSTGFRLGTGVGVTPKLFATTSWTKPVDNTSTNGVFFLDDTTMLITPGPKKPGPIAEAWSAYGDPATRLWYAVTELSRQIWMSSDNGLTWARTATFAIPGSMTGHIHGKAGIMYVQTEQRGLYRNDASDFGKNWVQVTDASLNNPSNVADTRTFYVGGCRGEMVIAFDEQGVVWKTVDGGNGTLGVKAEIGILHPVFNSISACDSEKRKFIITNLNCYDFQINSISFVTNTLGAYSLATTTLPDTIKSGDSRSFELAINPAQVPGNFNCRVHVSGAFLNGVKPAQVDSMIDVAVVVVGEQPLLTVRPSTIVMDTASICGGQSDSVFTLHNGGCDTLTITSQPSGLAPEFTIDNLALPYKLPKDSTISVRCHFKPTVAGAFQTYPVYGCTMQGHNATVQMELDGYGEDGAAKLVSWPQSIAFDTISLCAGGDSALVGLTNTGCVPLVLDSLTLDGDPDYSLGARSGSSPIKPNDSMHVWVHFSPKFKTQRITTVSIYTHSGSVDSTVMIDQIPVSAYVISGPAQATTSLGKIDFGTFSACDTRDSFITIRNTGCDTLNVDSLQLAGLGFTLGATPLPTRLAPNQSFRVPIHAAPSGTGTSFNGSIKVFSSNSVTPVPPVQLVFALQGTSPNIRLWATVDNPTGTDGAGQTIRIKADPATITQYSSVDVTLNWNLDLLGPLAIRGPNTVTPGGVPTGTGPWSYRISRTPTLAVDPDSSIAIIDCEIYLTKDTTTSVDLAVVRVNDTIPGSGPCTMQATASGTSFQYITTGCYQDVLGEYIRTGNVRITSIAPNPTRGDATLTIESPSKQQATIGVYDMLGKEVLRQNITITTGKNEITLATANLARSRYSLRIKTEHATVGGAFVKE